MAARLTCLALALGAVVFSALAFGQGTGTGVLKLPQDIEFKGPLTGPPEIVSCMAIRQSREHSSSRASDSRPAGKTRRIGTLMRCVRLWCYRARSTTATVTNGMRAS